MYWWGICACVRERERQTHRKRAGGTCTNWDTWMNLKNRFFTCRTATILGPDWQTVPLSLIQITQTWKPAWLDRFKCLFQQNVQTKIKSSCVGLIATNLTSKQKKVTVWKFGNFSCSCDTSFTVVQIESFLHSILYRTFECLINYNNKKKIMLGNVSIVIL